MCHDVLRRGLIAMMFALTADLRAQLTPIRTTSDITIVPPPGAAALAAQIMIPGGVFTMGATAEQLAEARAISRGAGLEGSTCDDLFDEELEAHSVELSPFWIDRTEVTVAAYHRCERAGFCPPPGFFRAGNRFDSPDLPVSWVTWDDAARYCEFRGGRLPTEAEWERAARGAHGRLFPWGNLPGPRRANHGRLGVDDRDDTDGFLDLAPVGSFPAGRTPEGIDDLAGNVEEWVLDSVADGNDLRYPQATQVNPKRVGSGAFRTTRGGGFTSPVAWIRGGARGFRPATIRRPDLGFRCVTTIGPP